MTEAMALKRIKFYIFLLISVVIGLLVFTQYHNAVDSSDTPEEPFAIEKTTSNNNNNTNYAKTETKTIASVIRTGCFSSENDFFVDMLDFFRKAKLAVVLTETADLLRSKGDFERNLADERTTFERVGVLGENVKVLENVIDKLINCSEKRGAESELKIMKNYQEGVLVNVFFILRLATKDKTAEYLKSKNLPYYLWKRLHIRVFHQRGVAGGLGAARLGDG